MLYDIFVYIWYNKQIYIQMFYFVVFKNLIVSYTFNPEMKHYQTKVSLLSFFKWCLCFPLCERIKSKASPLCRVTSFSLIKHPSQWHTRLTWCFLLSLNHSNLLLFAIVCYCFYSSEIQQLCPVEAFLKPGTKKAY